MNEDERKTVDIGLSETGEPNRSALRPDRALVVDDDPAILDVIRALLERVGYFVETADTSPKAWTIFKRQSPDVVISDWKMPKADGIELVNQFKKADPHLATILMTGHGTKETVIDAFTRGKINYYISKPFKSSELLEIVSAAVKERKIALGEAEFRRRLETEIERATEELKNKNQLLRKKNVEVKGLYAELQVRQAKIEKTRDYLENLLDSSIDAIISVDHRHRIIFFGRGAEDMFGYPFNEVQGKPLHVVLKNGRRDMDRLLNRLAVEERVKNFEVEIQKKNGKVLFTDVSASSLSHEDGAAGLLLVLKDVADRKRLEEELRESNLILEKLSLTDGLTGLYNHRHFQQCLQDEFHRSRRFNSPMSLIMIDLDDFKMVNDTYGHPVGDKVLLLLADMIRESIREVDTAARYGGEEFAIILPQTDVENSQSVAERLKETIEHSPRFRAIESGLMVTASLGVCGYPDPGIKAARDMTRYADKALYRAKQIGKNRVVMGGSAGERPLGRGERLTLAEKRTILRRVADTLSATLNLNEILDYLLREISFALRQTETDPPCAIMLMDRMHGLQPSAESKMDVDHRKRFMEAALKALEERNVQVFNEGESLGPAASYPIILESPTRGREVVGVITIGTVPTDLDFFRDLANQAALGIVNAKLYHEVDVARKALEKKVNQLMTLSLMSMTLQRNALTYEDFWDDNRKLLARSLADAGFERVFVYSLDRENRKLVDGVDDSLRGDQAPPVLPLPKKIGASSLFRWLAEEKVQHYDLVKVFSSADRISALERSAMKALGLQHQELGLAKLVENNRTQGLVVCAKKRFTDDDRDVMSQFVLQASMIIENLNLTHQFQEKTRRLTLIHQIGVDLSAATTPADRTEAARRALEGLTEVLRAAEISIYSFRPQDQMLRLVAYTSASARPGREPVRQIPLKETRIMSLVVKHARKQGLTAPLVLNDVERALGRRKGHGRFATSAYLGVPLYGGGDLLGIMNVTDKLDKSEFMTDDVEVAQITAGMLTPALHNLSLIIRSESRALDTFDGLVGILEDGSLRKGRCRRLTRLAEVLADGLGLDPHEVLQSRAAVLRGALDRIRADELDKGEAGRVARAALTLGRWLDDFMDQTRAETGQREAGHEAIPDILAVAEAFDSAYLGLKPSERPALPEALAEMLRHRRFNQDTIAALILALLQARITSGGRRIRLEDKDRGLLSDLLSGSVSAKPKLRLPKNFKARLLDMLAEPTPAASKGRQS
ncbi:MAG: diguanylate cyclase [Proteobacteria bacterium]|nr:diguanylate cyclase [Pseudomonadota bacterium]